MRAKAADTASTEHIYHKGVCTNDMNTFTYISAHFLLLSLLYINHGLSPLGFLFSLYHCCTHCGCPSLLVRLYLAHSSLSDRQSSSVV